MKRTGTLLLALFLGVCFASHCGATVYHSDGSAINVQLIHDIQAIDGDTITLPTGVFTWMSGVNVTKAITIQGNTTVNSDTGVCNDLTKIVDNVPRPNGRIFRCANTSSTELLRVTGITFTGVGGALDQNYNGMIIFSGGGSKHRIDHCHFTGHLKELNYFAVYGSNSGPTYGVADHLVMDGFEGSQTGQQQAQNGTSPYGDPEWTQLAGYGGPNFFFMEDCYLDNSQGMNTVGGGWDSGRGGRYVVRHCHLFNVELLNHGTETSGRNRGGRCYELYNNDYHWSYQTTMDGIRSGSMIAHDNTYTGVKPRGYGLQTYRTFYSFSPWGGADGTNPWDSNDPVLYDSGTTTGGSSNSITDTNKNWTTNQWVGFVFKRLSDGQVGKVISNDNHTAIVYLAGFPYSWTAGQAYQIHRVPYVVLDQVCRGRGDLITGDIPINSTTGTPAWPHQDIEPCYSWNNVYTPDGSTVNWSIQQNPPLQEGHDYFSDTALPGYTPYTYPHPLVTGNNPTPTPTAAPSPTSTPTPTAPILINCGGPTYLDSAGQLWSADMDFVGGSTFSTTHSITGTSDPTLYQTERYAPTLTYNIPVVNDTYTVTLYFAEIYFDAPGQRVFNASIEGQTVLQNFDIWAVAGQFAAVQRTFVVTVTDGVLNIVATATVNNAKFSAIQVVPGSPAPTPTPTPTPTPDQCEVPNFIGTNLSHAQRLWNDAGFTTEVIILPGPADPIDHDITWQSLPEGFIGSCSDTTITVE